MNKRLPRVDLKVETNRPVLVGLRRLVRRSRSQVKSCCESAWVTAKAKRRRPLLQRPGELACLLGNPGAGRVGGAAGEVNAAAAELDEEEHVVTAERERLDGEEVTGERTRRLLTEELAPARPCAPRRGLKPPRPGAAAGRCLARHGGPV